MTKQEVSAATLAATNYVSWRITTPKDASRIDEQFQLDSRVPAHRLCFPLPKFRLDQDQFGVQIARFGGE